VLLSIQEQARGGNGRQDAQPSFAQRRVTVLRRRRLEFRLPCFEFVFFVLGGVAAVEIAWDHWH
jgi:hypothetical protein